MLYTMLSIFGILFFIPHSFTFPLPDPYTKFSKLNLPVPGPFGPDSVARDSNNQGPYVGVSDGRILKYNGTDFVDFAYLSPNRSKQLCDGVTDLSLGPICGRPLGFSFDPLTNYLYVVEICQAINFTVGPQGGQATLLATSAYGVPFNFLNGCDFDKIRRVVYFTDTSLVYNYTDAILGNPLPPGDSSGRLLEYSTITGLVRVLVNGIPRPSGPAVSADSSFIVYGSYSTQQIYKYYLIGPKSGTTDVLIPNLLGSPAKTKRAAEFGYFWVAVNQVVQTQPTPVFQPYGYKFSSNGNVIVIKNFTLEYGNGRVNVVQEYFNLLEGGTLYVGSRSANYVGKYTKC
ncbi:OLC1v1039209C1 [Oldenlandia corymbosa var. corymbosa]|uniref:OLC1v1039209C1 n=1 Tax=Oldenlandia corymbosa var. corymbosa TaxID=529605 RepID=A0AAV1D268_OLDCO|nr:OLC1v1039209C1 [Oldenlandia corymbosa var. corymbosa]